MLDTFRNDERGYGYWMYKNFDGFVFNHFGGSDASYNKLHKASCTYLHRPQDEGVRTRVEKVCGDDLNELKQRVEELRGTSWEYCRSCFR